MCPVLVPDTKLRNYIVSASQSVPFGQPEKMTDLSLKCSEYSVSDNCRLPPYLPDKSEEEPDMSVVPYSFHPLVAEGDDGFGAGSLYHPEAATAGPILHPAYVTLS